MQVLGGRALLRDPAFLGQHEIIIGVGDTALRRELSLMVISRGGHLATIIHPSSVIADDVSIGVGTAIMAKAVVNTGSRIGRFAVVNTGAIIDHDNQIADGVHISPGSALAGRVVCHDDAFVGTGASIIPRVTVGARAIVGAGATVITDVSADTVVVGCPARQKAHA
jgi:acetyltransferase EpsM